MVSANRRTCTSARGLLERQWVACMRHAVATSNRRLPRQCCQVSLGCSRFLFRQFTNTAYFKYIEIKKISKKRWNVFFVVFFGKPPAIGCWERIVVPSASVTWQHTLTPLSRVGVGLRSARWLSHYVVIHSNWLVCFFKLKSCFALQQNYGRKWQTIMLHCRPLAVATQSISFAVASIGEIYWRSHFVQSYCPRICWHFKSFYYIQFHFLFMQTRVSLTMYDSPSKFVFFL